MEPHTITLVIVGVVTAIATLLMILGFLQAIYSEGEGRVDHTGI